MALQGTKLTLLRLSQAQARSFNTDLRGNKDQDPAINHRFEVPRAVGYTVGTCKSCSPTGQNANSMVDVHN